MSTKLKLIILKKILPESRKNAIRNYIHNMQVVHKNGKRGYFIDYNKSPDEILSDTGQFEDKIKIVDSKNKNVIRFAIEKHFFMESIINGIIKPAQIDSTKKRVVIDFSSPNIAKPFHFGHLRSTIIGKFIANINKHYNNNVTRINYIGDWGTQFGLLQYGLKIKNINVEDLQKDPIRNLYDVYVYANKLAVNDERVHNEARQYFSNVEEGKENLDSWKKIRNVTVTELAKIYKRLGIQFDEYHWESDYNGKAIKDLMSLLHDRNIIRADETGKLVAKVKDRNVAVLKSDYSSLYLSRDIAALVDRYEKYKFDEMLYIVDNSQTDHFAAVFEVVKQIDTKYVEGCHHVKFGRIKGMSTRRGNVVFLNDILDEAKDKMFEKQQQSRNTRSAAMNEETCDKLGTTAVIINDLKQRRQRDYVFEWDKALQSEGDSGIKLQYLHCRLWSLEKNCGVTLPDKLEPNHLLEPIVLEVIVELARFEDILLKANNEYEACIIVNYLFKLARHVNRMFNELNVKNVDRDLAAQRLLVFHAARCVVKTGLEILGVKPLCEM